MRRNIVIFAVILVFTSGVCLSSSYLVYFKNGRVLKVSSKQDNSDWYTFGVAKGQIGVPKDQIEKIVESEVPDTPPGKNNQKPSLAKPAVDRIPPKDAVNEPSIYPSDESTGSVADTTVKPLENPDNEKTLTDEQTERIEKFQQKNENIRNRLRTNPRQADK